MFDIAPKSPGEEVIVTILENPKWQESVEMITLPPLGKNSYKIYLQVSNNFVSLCYYYKFNLLNCCSKSRVLRS